MDDHWWYLYYHVWASKQSQNEKKNHHDIAPLSRCIFENIMIYNNMNERYILKLKLEIIQLFYLDDILFVEIVI